MDRDGQRNHARRASAACHQASGAGMFAYVKMGCLDKFPFLKDSVWCGLNVFDGPAGGRRYLVDVGIMDGKPQASL